MEGGCVYVCVGRMTVVVFVTDAQFAKGSKTLPDATKLFANISVHELIYYSVCVCLSLIFNIEH